MTDIDVMERGTVVDGSFSEGGRKFRVRIIEGDRLGSSGYYPADVVKRDGPSIFAVGTHCYVDHPTESEKFERPERSIRDLAGRIASVPVYEGDGLYADVEVIPSVAPMIEALMSDIGMSIRARGTYELADIDGQMVKKITALTMGESVDFVTKAGAGGKITQLIESVRAAHVTEATSRDIERALDAALSDQFGGTDTYVWVCDFDDTTVWYQVSGPDDSDTYQLGYTVTDDAVVTLATDTPVEVTRRTEYVPVSSAGGTTATTESATGDSMEITEAEHRRLTEAAEQVARERELREAAERDLATERGKTAATEASTDARVRAGKLLESVEVQPSTKARIVESVLAGLPMTGDGKLDVPAFEARVTERATSEATYEAELLREAGVGRISGEGGSGEPPAAATEADQKVVEAAESVLADLFKDQGLSEAEVRSAVTGRA